MSRLEKRSVLSNGIINVYIDRFITDDGIRLWSLVDAWSDFRPMVLAWSEKETENILNILPKNDDDDSVEGRIFEYINSKVIDLEKVYSVVRKLVESLDTYQMFHYNRYLRDHTEDPHFHLSHYFVMSIDTLEEGQTRDLFYELLMNSIEEYQLGYGNEITLKKTDKGYEFFDNASGIPVEYSDKYGDREWKRILIDPSISEKYAEEFAEDYYTNYGITEYITAGKYKKCPLYSYKYSHPKGSAMRGGSLVYSKAVSEYMLIETVRDNKLYTFEFKNGYMTKEKTVSDANGKVGTHICWKPSNDIFKNTEISRVEILEIAETQAILNPGLKITVDYEGKTNSFLYNKGIKDYLAELVPYDEKSNIRYRKIDLCSHYDDGACNHECFEMAIVLSEAPIRKYYHNSKERTFVGLNKMNEYISEFIEKKKFSLFNNDKDRLKEFTVDNVSKRIAVIISTNSEYSSYENESYKSINSIMFDAAFKNLLINELYFLYKEAIERENKKDEGIGSSICLGKHE